MLVEAWAAELEADRVSDFSSASPSFQAIQSPIHTPLMRRLQDLLEVEDKALPDQLLLGLPIVGRAVESPFFTEFDVAPTLTLKELLLSAPARRARILDSMMEAGLGSNPDATIAAFDKTQKEVGVTMSPAMTADQVTARHGQFWNVVRRYGIEQGVDSSGKKKYRAIDDHSENDNNSAAWRRQKIPMAGVATLMLMVKLFASVLPDVSDADLVGGTEDMKGAYRQVALCSSQLMVCITAVYNPKTGKVDLHELYGQPFGAGHSVPNFYRLAEWGCRVARRLLNMALEHFFDDFFYVEPRFCAAVGCWAFRRVLSILGLVLDREKSQLPAAVWVALGVVFDARALRSERLLFVRPKPSRVTSVVEELHKVLRNNRCGTSQAARLAGKADFINSTLFGRVGRAGLSALKARQYSKNTSQDLTPWLSAGVSWLAAVLSQAPPRELRLGADSERPFLLYTDGSAEPKAGGPRVDFRNLPPACRLSDLTDMVVGAVLVCPGGEGYYTYAEVPDAVAASWLPKKQMIGQVELFGGALALATWRSMLETTKVIHFVDNDSATAALIKGYSPKADSAAIVGDYWLLAAKHKILIYVDRVESKSNISDGPSRRDFALMQIMGLEWSLPCLDLFLQRSAGGLCHPALWFTR